MMKRNTKKFTAVLAVLLALVFAAVSVTGCGAGGTAAISGSNTTSSSLTEETSEQASRLDESGTYDSRDEVAAYIHEYDKLPSNYITKKEARSLGWEGGSLEDYAPGKCIGGDHFGNYEGVLPKEDSYTECDIDTLGARSRGAKRIVFSDDGDIYYTEDHYKHFQQLYDEDGKVS